MFKRLPPLNMLYVLQYNVHRYGPSRASYVSLCLSHKMNWIGTKWVHYWQRQYHQLCFIPAQTFQQHDIQFSLMGDALPVQLLLSGTELRKLHWLT